MLNYCSPCYVQRKTCLHNLIFSQDFAMSEAVVCSQLGVLLAAGLYEIVVTRLCSQSVMVVERNCRSLSVWPRAGLSFTHTHTHTHTNMDQRGKQQTGWCVHSGCTHTKSVELRVEVWVCVCALHRNCCKTNMFFSLIHCSVLANISVSINSNQQNQHSTPLLVSFRGVGWQTERG